MLTGKDTTDSLLPELKMPVLILWGKEDRITPLDAGQEDAAADSAVGAAGV